VEEKVDAYPILSLMARDFLAIPVSTVSSESAFSAAVEFLEKIGHHYLLKHLKL
jgi:hypothetical protein